jgi:hypothetical protein
MLMNRASESRKTTTGTKLNTRRAVYNLSWNLGVALLITNPELEGAKAESTA